MTTYHFVIGKGTSLIKLSFVGHNAVDALAKLVNYFNTSTIKEVFAGQKDGAHGSGKTSFPELKGKPLFDQPKRSNPFAECPPLLEEEADMQPTNIEQAQ